MYNLYTYYNIIKCVQQIYPKITTADIVKCLNRYDMMIKTKTYNIKKSYTKCDIGMIILIPENYICGGITIENKLISDLIFNDKINLYKIITLYNNEFNKNTCILFVNNKNNDFKSTLKLTTIDDYNYNNIDFDINTLENDKNSNIYTYNYIMKNNSNNKQ